MSEPQRGARLHNLDVLRGVAVLLVLWRHVPIRADLSLGGAEWLVGRLHRIGWCGVDLFYVLSGFLISGLLFKEFNRDGRLNLPRFWMRRGFKIWPSYFCAYGLLVLLTAAHALVRGDDARLHAVLQSILPNTAFVQNYFPEPQRWPNSWSLAVEEHFYLALPLLLAGLVVWGRRRGQTSPEQWFRTLPLLGIGVGVGVLALRLGWKRFHGGTWEQFYYATHMRADSLFFGVVLGCLQHYRPEWFGWLARLGPVWVLLALAALALPWCCSLTQDAVTYTVGFTALYLGFGGLVLLAGAYPTFGRDGPAGRLTRVLAWVGVYSYTIYLAHSIIYILPGSWGLRRCVLFLVPGDSPLPAMWVDRALFFGLSIAGGVLLSHGVERPFLRWRERWSFTAPRATATPNPEARTPIRALPRAA